MVSERELVGLLYRADWTKLTLSGTVTGTEPVTDIIIVQSARPPSGSWRQHDPGPGPSWSFTPGGADAGCTLSVAPGLRFRADGTDGDWALGCDGTRMWHWFRDRPADTSAQFAFTGSEVRFDLSGSDRPRPPYRALLAPTWLLTGYFLALDGEETIAGRPGVRVRGTVRTVAERTTRVGGRPGRSTGIGGLFAPLPRWLSGPEPCDEQVEAVVDAELGILLRCSRWSADAAPRVTEFVSLSVAGTVESPVFSAPAGSVFSDDTGGSWPRRPQDQQGDQAGGTSFGDAVGEALGAAGKEAAKAVAGLAAGGLGALIKYAPRPRVDPFAQAAAEAADPEAELPADETAPDGAAAATSDSEALPDELLHMVYRSGVTPPSFGATLHQWFDIGALIAAVPESVRGGGFGGVGFLVDTLRDNARESTAGASHAMSTVRMGGWREYRIDVVRSASDAAFFRSRRLDKRAKDQALTIASDGERQWHVLPDRVVSGPASPPPSELADLLDASWLLDPALALSGGSETMLGGRRAFRIVATCREPAWIGLDSWKRLFFPAVAVVDAETGRLLRLTRFKGGRPTMRQELRDTAELGPGADFGFTPPSGRPCYDAETMGKEHRPGARAWFWDSQSGTWGWSREPPPGALPGNVRLGPAHRGSQLAEESAGAVGGVADRRGGDRQGGHRLACLVPDAQADRADARLRLLDVLRVALVADEAELVDQGTALGDGHALGRAAVRSAQQGRELGVRELREQRLAARGLPRGQDRALPVPHPQHLR
jgi:hypothetical protein